MAKRISCSLYDYFEIVCMRNSEVVVSLKNKQQFSGIAKALIHENGTEFLSLMQSDQTLVNINLTDVTILSACNNAIKHHNFSVSLI